MSKLRLSYQTIEFGETDIHLCTLRDKQQFHDPAGVAAELGISSAFWPLFGIVWPSSLVLAHYIDHYQTENLRILEVGCGIGLSSLLLNKKHADITATDYHPEVEHFLKRNATLNEGKPIAFARIDWAEQHDQLGLFDLIIGSDLLYEDQHIALLANFIQQHASPTSVVILVDPGRGRKNKLSQHMLDFGYRATHFKPQNTEAYLDHDFKGHVMKFERA